MRPAHATSPEQLRKLFDCEGWFDLDDVALDAESRRVVVPFRVCDDAVIVEAPRGLVRRLLRRPGDRYSPWRRWLLHINRAVALEIDTRTPPADDVGPCDFLAIDFDSEDSTVDIYGDMSPVIVSVSVESIDVVVEETSEHVGWRQEDAPVSGVVLPAPPPGFRRIAKRSWL